MPVQESDNLAPGAAVARSELGGAHAIGDVVLHDPEHGLVAIAGL